VKLDYFEFDNKKDAEYVHQNEEKPFAAASEEHPEKKKKKKKKHFEDQAPEVQPEYVSSSTLHGSQEQPGHKPEIWAHNEAPTLG